MKRKIFTFSKMSLAQLFLISMTLLMNSSHFINPYTLLNLPPIIKIMSLLFLNKLDLPHVSEDSKAKLNSDFTRAEILTSLKSLNLNRSPGYDGLPAEFYVVFFNDICDMLVDCYQHSFDHGFMSMTQCNGVITLLPKKDKDPHFIKNYSPITLLNTADYKNYC